MRRSRTRSGHTAAFVIFFATGSVFGTWAARVPAVQARLDLSPGELGVAVLGLEGGAVAGLAAGGALVTRLGSRSALRLAFVVYAPGLVAAALAPSLIWLAIVLALWAGANSIVDVGMNAQGVELERRRGQPVMSRLHAGHSLGVVVGGLAGTGAAAAALSPLAHFAGVSALGLAAAVGATRRLVQDGPPAPAPGATARPRGTLLLLGLLAFCGFLVDGTANSWSAVHVRTEHGAGSAVAAATFTAFALAVALGRLAGDRLTAYFGRADLVRAAGIVVVCGSATAISAPTTVVAVCGWAVVGLGVAVVAPVALAAAPAARAMPPAGAIATVTTIGYLGSFTGPPAIGALATVAGLSTALVIVTAAGLMIVLVARRALASTGGSHSATAENCREPRLRE